jgi:asparagine synthase (glutamine-hydrolysing)
MVLTGEGSDEIFGGYPKYQGETWIALYQTMIPDVVHRAVFAPLIHALPYAFHRAKVAATAAGERNFVKRMAVWFGGMTWDDCTRLANRELSDDFHGPVLDDASPLRRMLYFDQSVWLPDNLLERGDRMMMAGSIEGRMPFMDQDIASFAARLPDSFLIAKGQSKRILRAALKKKLPARILERRKIGFQVPVGAWFRGTKRPLLRDLLASDDARIAAICRSDRLKTLVQEHLDGRQDNSRTLWALANLEMFLREFRLGGEAIAAAAHETQSLLPAQA